MVALSYLSLSSWLHLAKFWITWSNHLNQFQEYQMTFKTKLVLYDSGTIQVDKERNDNFCTQ